MRCKYAVQLLVSASNTIAVIRIAHAPWQDPIISREVHRREKETETEKGEKETFDEIGLVAIARSEETRYRRAGAINARCVNTYSAIEPSLSLVARFRVT